MHGCPDTWLAVFDAIVLGKELLAVFFTFIHMAAQDESNAERRVLGDVESAGP